MSITSKSTKAEILEAYNSLLQAKEQLEAKVEQLRAEKQTAGKDMSKTTAQVRISEQSVVPSTLDGIIATLSALRPAFGDAVSELSAQLIAEASKLAELRRKVEEDKQHVKTLHEIDVAEGTLDQLIQEYSEKSSTFETEAKEREQAFAQDMDAKRKAWQKEQEEHARLIKERDADTKKTEQREAAEYQYDLELKRKLDNEAYAQQQQQLQKALEDFEDAKRKEWAAREKQIADQEQEFAELKVKVEKSPKELETAVKKAREEAADMTRRQIKRKADVRAKEVEGERRLQALKIQSLENAIEKQFQHLDSLKTQLDAAVKQVQDLAMKAIEGASSAGSLQAVREIALEQAKNVQKAK